MTLLQLRKSRRALTTLVLAAVIAGASVAQAQLSEDSLPNMDGLIGALGEDSGSTESVINSEGKISSGLIAPRTGRSGERADSIAALFAEGQSNPKQVKAKVKQAILKEVELFEAFLRRNEFAERDVGAALVVFFIVNWELATGTQLPIEGSLALGKQLMRAFKAQVDKGVIPVGQLSGSEMDATYDTLITSAVALGAFVKAYEKAGHTKEAQYLRQQAGKAFTGTFAMQPADVTISAQGHIQVARSHGSTSQPPELRDSATQGDNGHEENIPAAVPSSTRSVLDL